jgi:hypothetical protein
MVSSAASAPPYCSFGNATSLQKCPSEGSQAISLAFEISSSYPFVLNPMPMNFTMGAGGEIQRLVSLSKNIANATATVWASSVPDFIGPSFYSLWSEAADGFPRDRLKVVSSLRKPTFGLQKAFVEAVCNYPNSNSSVIQFPSRGLFLTPSTDDVWTTTINSTTQILADTNTSMFSTAFQWVDLGDSYSARPSAAGIFFIGQTNLSVFPCTLSAAWVPLDAWLDLSEDNFVHDNTPNPSNVGLNLQASSLKGNLTY